MPNYVRQRPLPTSSLSLSSIQFIVRFLMFFNLFTCCLHGIDGHSATKPSLQAIFQLRNAPVTSPPPKRLLRVIYFREFNRTINENFLKADVQNLTATYGVDFKLSILEQSKSFAMTKFCSLISQERRDTIILADLYTKEIDLISRALKIPTIALINRYQIVQGKLHNPYLFKLMPDGVEEAKAMVHAMDNRAVYTRIAVIYDVSLDMVEYRLSYLRLAKQFIIYRAHLPRISLFYELHRAARIIIYDLTQIDTDLILCFLSNERQLQFIRLIKEYGSLSTVQLLLNRTSWWFASRMTETYGFNYFPKIYTASADRSRTLSHLPSIGIKTVLNAVVKTYIRVSNISVISSLFIGPSTCSGPLDGAHLRKTQAFIKLFTNYTEWNCEFHFGSGVDPLLFDSNTLTWRVPTIFMPHTEHSCQGMLTRTFYTGTSNADHFFRSCRPMTLPSRKGPSLPDNATSRTASNALVDITNYHPILTPKGRRRHKVFSLASALTLSWSIVFSHTFKTKSPKCWSNRFLGNVWGGFGIVFIAIYTAKLASFMVELDETQTATSVHGVIDGCGLTSKCIIGVVANTSDEEYMRKFFTNTLYSYINYVPSYAQGIESLRNRSITHLFMDHSMARYYLTRQVFKAIRISGDNFGTFGLSLGFSKVDTEFKKNITNVLISYVDKGIIQRLHDEWYVYENCEIKRLNEDRMLPVERLMGVFILLAAGMVVGSIILILEWIIFKYGVPYWRKRQSSGWMFFSQRLYAAINASDEIFNEAYRPSRTRSFRYIGERLHNHATRSGSLDLRVVDVPKLLCETYQLKEQMNKFHAQQQQQDRPPICPNGDVCRSSLENDGDDNEEQQSVRIRINELERELNQLRLQLTKFDNDQI